MNRTVHPARIDGVLAAPPSKSVMLRATAGALLAGEVPTRLSNPSTCADARSGLRVVAALGARVTEEPGLVTIVGGLRNVRRVLDCGESGLCLRMFSAIAALGRGEVTLTGESALRKRPTTPIEAPLAALGAWAGTEGGRPPVVVRGPLVGGEAVVDGSVSSQFLTGLLMALPLAPRDSVLTVENLASRPYVDLTLRVLDRFGVRVDREEGVRYRVPGGQSYRPIDLVVEGDWSAAAFLLVLGAVGGRIRAVGLDPDSAQADRGVLEALEAAGARVDRLPDGAEVRRGDLAAFEFDVTHAPDLLPPLTALAVHCEGRSAIAGAGRLRHKESSRAEVVAREFDRLGARVDLAGDVLHVTGGPVRGGTASANGDHRIAMALAAAAVGARGPVTIEGAEHVAKSWPGFFEDLVAAGGRVDG